MPAVSASPAPIDWRRPTVSGVAAVLDPKASSCCEAPLSDEYEQAGDVLEVAQTFSAEASGVLPLSRKPGLSPCP